MNSLPFPASRIRKCHSIRGLLLCALVMVGSAVAAEHAPAAAPSTAKPPAPSTAKPPASATGKPPAPSTGKPPVAAPGVDKLAPGVDPLAELADPQGAAGAPTPRATVAHEIAEGLVSPEPDDATASAISEFAPMLDAARRHRREGNREAASRVLTGLLESTAPSDLKRQGMLELALVAQEEGNLSRAQQVLAQYIQLNPQHPTIVEAYLRQGMIYRQMGASGLAIAKFYSVMTSALSLRLDQLEYYQRLVLRAQTEIAETYYVEGRWEEAKDFLTRLLKMDSKHLDRAQVHFKLIRTYAAMGRLEQTVAQGLVFITKYPEAGELPEVRFLVASAFKKQGRNDEALRQTLLLMESQQQAARENPQGWAYWQKRAGNEIANQLYLEGDFLGTLEIYNHLAAIDSSGPWQVPVWYQIGLVYERLQQPEKARSMFTNILARAAEVSGTNGTPGLEAVLEMSKWRIGHLSWLQGAQTQSSAILQSAPPPVSPSGTPTASPSEARVTPTKPAHEPRSTPAP